MKGAIASVEIFGFLGKESARRFTLTIAAPTRAAAGEGWECRVSLANLHRPRAVAGTDSVEALASALDVARGWVAELRKDGFALYRDRAGRSVYEGV